MSALPDPPLPTPDEPPLVALTREKLRASPRWRRAVDFARRHRSFAAVAGAAAAVWKTSRWLAPLLFTRDSADWLLGHWFVVVAAGAAVFVVAFVTIRLGIDWADRWMRIDEGLAAAAENVELGPAWASRPPDASTRHIPPRMG